jgi:glyoxylase-like metal-dependent hydrolase (beta-lactamase superfamily II)
MPQSIPISPNDIVPLHNIAQGVFGLRILFVNVFAVRTPQNRWTLIDTGLPFSADKIRRWTERYVGPAPGISSIVLTHGHFDHVGAVKELAEEWGVPVYAHSIEMPYLTGQQKYPPPDPSVGGGMMARMAPLYPRDPIDLGDRVRELPANGSIPDLEGWRWIHTPGHTEGHISLFRERDRTLIAGDAFCTTKQESLFAVATQRPELHGPPAYYTPDWDAARSSVQKLAALQPETIAAGHGQPMTGGETAAKLAELAARFDEIAIPEHGRYVHEPAVIRS